MQEREQIIQEYFKLRVFLNRANKLSNQQAEIRIEIKSVGERQELWFYSDVQGESHGLVLCDRTPKRMWAECGGLGFGALEKYCRTRLRSYSKVVSASEMASRLLDDLTSLRIE